MMTTTMPMMVKMFILFYSDRMMAARGLPARQVYPPHSSQQRHSVAAGPVRRRRRTCRPLLAPAPVPVIPAPAEQQEQHEDNENEVHGFLRQIRGEFPCWPCGCGLIIRQPRILPTRDCSAAATRPSPRLGASQRTALLEAETGGHRRERTRRSAPARRDLRVVMPAKAGIHVLATATISGRGRRPPTPRRVGFSPLTQPARGIVDAALAVRGVPPPRLTPQPSAAARRVGRMHPPDEVLPWGLRSL
jgi:hypothetical protein